MDDAAVVGGGEAGAELAGGFERLVAGEAADAGEQRSQVFAIHVFHGNEGHAFHFADIEHAADVGVGNQAGDAYFAVEALKEAGVVRGFLGQELEGDGLGEHEVGGAIDFAHAAAAEQAENAVAAAEQGSGSEAAFVLDRRCGSEARDFGLRDGSGPARHGDGFQAGGIGARFHSFPILLLVG